ncbi:AcrR family transcriptional regulator [Novosphingobium sp. SG751A]|uniref:TetR family transcriptional regulator n=1 Tax=Novosphingobium sp. SG751A TaxID=2587000 RepID=UPI00155539D5|nr:TetR family transcriptional regulator [Novosphingobium sp. SG751A]NOW48696.1 AcrR family transcriptional regulator [Novosphingobium sp. SG751A]
MMIPVDDKHAAQPIVAAALDLIASHGLTELTLRPLAEKVGMSLNALTQTMGSKEQLLAQVIAHAMEQDRLFREGWQKRLGAMAPVGPGLRAVLAETILDDWVVGHRPLACLLIDMVQEAGRQEGCPAALGAWLDAAGLFWAEVLFGDPRQADAALGYMLDEAGFSLFAHADPAYRMLRALCLHRFTGGIYPQPDEDIGTGRHLEQWIAALEPEQTYPDTPDRSKRGLIAAQAGHLIVTQGLEALTHRSAAAAAGTPASTVVYHFGTRDDLMVAALHAVVTNFRHNLAENFGRPHPFHAHYDFSRDLVRATSIIALAAARHPGLAHHALDMRRRRGENIVTSVLWDMGLPHGRTADRCTSQVASVALFGMRMVAMARGLDEHQVLLGAFTRLAEVCR